MFVLDSSEKLPDSLWSTLQKGSKKELSDHLQQGVHQDSKEKLSNCLWEKMQKGSSGSVQKWTGEITSVKNKSYCDGD